MIYSCLARVARDRSDREFLIAEGAAHTYGDVLARVQELAGRIEEVGEDRWLVCVEDSTQLVFLMLALDAVCGEVCVLDSGSKEDEVELISRRLGVVNLISDVGLELETVNQFPLNDIASRSKEPTTLSRTNDSAGEGSIVILTTGTTAAPKGAKYSWSRLIRQIRVSPRLEGSRWLLTYHLNHFAGIQVLLHALCNGGALVIPDSMDVGTILTTIRRHNVGYLSGTPTFWRMFTGLLRDGDCREIQPEHITIGGEAITDDVLERIKRHFPRVRVSQMYVTTELGVCFTVRDGRKGFPLSYLENSDLPVQLKIEDGELYVRSPHGMKEYLGGEGPAEDGWFATGDLVRVEGDRVLFMGRKSEVINVGGSKVHPHGVEEVILAVEGVQGVRVFGVENPITGQIVAADVQLFPGYENRDVEQRIREVCKRKLDRYKQPRLFRFVDALPTLNQKVVRKAL